MAKNGGKKEDKRLGGDDGKEIRYANISRVVMDADAIHNEIKARMEELKPLVDEYATLIRVDQALATIE